MRRATRELQQQCEALVGQAEVLREHGDAVEALVRYREALEVAQRLAQADERHRAVELGLRAEIEVQEGVTQLARGWGASAVLHLDRAVNGYLTLLRGTRRRAEENRLALLLTRAMMVNADALSRYGDPHLAANAADSGFRGYLGQHGTPGWSVGEMGRLATSASAILARAGRLATALVADEIAVKAAGETAQRSGSADDRQWLASALVTWAMHLLATGDSGHRAQAATCLGEGQAVDAAAARRAQQEWERVQAVPPPVTLASALQRAEQELGAIPAGLANTYTDPPVNIVTPAGRRWTGADPGCRHNGFRRMEWWR